MSESINSEDHIPIPQPLDEALQRTLEEIDSAARKEADDFYKKLESQTRELAALMQDTLNKKLAEVTDTQAELRKTVLQLTESYNAHSTKVTREFDALQQNFVQTTETLTLLNNGLRVRGEELATQNLELSGIASSAKRLLKVGSFWLLGIGFLLILLNAAVLCLLIVQR